MLPLEGVNFESGNSYTIKIELSQEGDPWDLVETETHRFVISVITFADKQATASLSVSFLMTSLENQGGSDAPPL